jgi:hypothetical protein
MNSQNKKVKKQNLVKPEGPITYVIYAIEPPKKINGLLGQIDFHCIHLLLTDGQNCVQETVPAECDPVEWYKDVLESQEMYVKAVTSELSNRRVWIEVDTDRTKIEEFTGWRDTFAEGSLVWRTFWFPTNSDTFKECLGFEVTATKQYISHELSLSKAFHTILEKSGNRP